MSRISCVNGRYYSHSRSALIIIAHHLELTKDERPVSVTEAKSPKEAFFTSATSFLTAVTQVNGKVLSSGEPGPLSIKLFSAYLDYVGDQKLGSTDV